MDMLSQADVTYVRAGYMTLEEHCADRFETPDELLGLVERGLLPRPSYILPDGTPMFPADWLALADESGGPEHVRKLFTRRYLAVGDPELLEAEWEGYLSGVYGVCLRRVTPETIARKGELVDDVTALLESPAPHEPSWREALRSAVDELDDLEREFSPDYDRVRFDRPPTRDSLIRGARERYPDVWGGTATRAA
jgi:hypothetical protein